MLSSKWIEIDVGPPAPKKCKISQKLLDSDLPETLCQDLHKKDQQMDLEWPMSLPTKADLAWA